MVSKRRIVRRASLWISVMAVAIGVLPTGSTALSAGEIALFTDTFFNCPDGGKGLYTTINISDLSSWGFNNQASAFAQNGGWKLYDDFAYGTLIYTTNTGATSNCDLDADNDKVSSLKEY